MRARACRRSAWKSSRATGAPSSLEMSLEICELRVDQMSNDRFLLVDQLLDAVVREVEQRVERVAAERQRLRRPLHLDEPAVAGLDDVHVDFGAAVVLVREV